jgi:hypothetical protein
MRRKGNLNKARYKILAFVIVQLNLISVMKRGPEYKYHPSFPPWLPAGKFATKQLALLLTSKSM